MYARINLAQTNYDSNSIDIDARLITDISKKTCLELESIYDQYCKYKQFPSVMPLFFEEYRFPQSDVFGYYDDSKLVAFTLMFRYNSANLAANQFAWNYENPKLRLGMKSLEWICSYYKKLKFEYIYLGDAA